MRALLPLLIIALTAPLRAGPESSARRIEAFTGARTRIVWLHAVRGDQKNWDGLAPDYELKGLDTAEGNAKVILPGPALYGNPCISRDGKWIVYCASAKGMLGKIYRVDWDGRKKLELAPGYILDTWEHPDDGSQWAYYTPGGYQKGDLMRVRLDQPEVKERFFPRTVGQVAHTLSVSADGKRIGTEFPWPHAGIGITGKKPMCFHYGRGCNAIIAPDNSYRVMYMGGSVNHDGVMMYDAGDANVRAVWFKQFPGVKAGSHSWVPRWSNHVRYVTVCAPLVYGRGLNDMDIHLGKFNEAFTEATDWIKITDVPGRDVKAYAWIDPQLGYHQDEAPFRLEIPETRTPGAWRFDYGDGSTGAGRRLGNLAKMVYKQEPLILHALGVSDDRQRRYTRPVEDHLIRQIEASRPTTTDELNRLWYGYHNSNPHHYDSSRYHGVNLHNVWYRGTVEFRYFESTLHAGKIKAYIQFCLAIAAKALTARAASSKKREFSATSAKYDFRCWLLRLGLIGDEFKTARLHLMANMPGSAAWKNGRPGAEATANA